MVHDVMDEVQEDHLEDENGREVNAHVSELSDNSIYLVQNTRIEKSTQTKLIYINENNGGPKKSGQQQLNLFGFAFGYMESQIQQSQLSWHLSAHIMHFLFLRMAERPS